jgi:hypothetical protein
VAAPEQKRKVVADNRRARFNYEISDVVEAGIALTGTEVKSRRGGKATIAEAYAGPSGNDLFLFNAYIPEYLEANRFNHDTKATTYELYKYNPSIAGAVIFIIVFACLTIAHGFHMVKTRTWYCAPVVVGGLCMCTFFRPCPPVTDHIPSWQSRQSAM